MSKLVAKAKWHESGHQGRKSKTSLVHIVNNMSLHMKYCECRNLIKIAGKLELY
jgi:hypothetical protein